MFGSIEKVVETSMHTTALLNTLWEFTRGVEENKEGFIQKALKVFKTFKVKSLKRPKHDVPAKKTTYNLFFKDLQETKLKGATISKASAIISKKWEKVKVSDESCKSTETFTKWINSDMKKFCRDIKKIT